VCVRVVKKKDDDVGLRVVERNYDDKWLLDLMISSEQLLKRPTFLFPDL
jgi:hypothetical protein